MRNLSFFFAVFFIACQNQPAPPASSTAVPAEPTLGDTVSAGNLIGFLGTDVYRMHEVSENVVEYTFDRYTLRVESNDESVGETIQVMPKEGASFPVAMPDDGYFAGLSGDFLLIDSGTGPDSRLLVVVDLRTNTIVLEAPYANEVTVSDGKVQFFTPVERAALSTLPDCPDRADWEEKGLGVGYAYRTDYTLETKTTTPHKDEVICFPLQ